MKYSEINTLYNTLTGLKNKKLPRQLTVVVSRNLSILQPIMDVIHSQGSEITNKYASRKPNGELDITVLENGTFQLKFDSPESMQKYSNEMKQLEDVEEHIELVKVNSKVLDVIDSDSRFDILTPDDEMKLGSIINYEN